MEKQLSLELDNLSSGKRQHSSLEHHLSSKKEKKPKQKNQGEQLVSKLLPKTKKEPTLDLDFLSLEGVKSETSSLNETPPAVQTSDEQFLNKQSSEEQDLKKKLLFENRTYLISVKTVAEMLGLAPKTIHNWVSLRKIPYVKCGHKVMFRPKSFEAWLNRKEIKSWL